MGTKLVLVSVSITKEGSDGWSWNLESNGEFSVKSSYKISIIGEWETPMRKSQSMSLVVKCFSMWRFESPCFFILPTYIRGSMAAILSILQHSSCPQNILFHFIHSSNASILRATISTSFPYLKFHLYIFNNTIVSKLISTSIRSALDCPLNYARSYLPNLLPLSIKRVVYLDSDIILVDDITKLAETPLGTNSVLAAPEYCNANFTSYFTKTFWANPSLSLTFANRKPCYFNTGVMVIDLERWREGEYTAKIEEWMVMQKRMRIYELGSLPPFLLVFGGDIATVDHRWNQHGLGGDNFRGLCRDLHPGPVSLLHWSGKGKPWVRLDGNMPCPLDALWAPYDLLLHTPLSLDS